LGLKWLAPRLRAESPDSLRAVVSHCDFGTFVF